jgi:hypothetical protein
MFGAAEAFTAGVADPTLMQGIFADPNLKAQFGEALAILDARENRAAISARTTDKMPVSIQNQLTELATVKPMVARYRLQLNEWFKLSTQERALAAQGKFGNPETQELLGSIRSLRQQIAGKLRLAIVGPGAVSDSERRLLLQSIGDPLSIDTLIRGPDAAFGALSELEQTIISTESGLKSQWGLADIPEEGTGEMIDMTRTDYQTAIDTMLQSGMTDEQIKELMKNVRIISGGR